MRGSAVESMTTFDSTKESLLDLLHSIKQGKTQLPDFQRGWVWDDHHIRDLLASISLSFPIGAVMMLQIGNPDVRFKPRLVEGVNLADAPEPERLILDGQQRLTSLFLGLVTISALAAAKRAAERPPVQGQTMNATVPKSARSPVAGSNCACLCSLLGIH